MLVLCLQNAAELTEGFQLYAQMGQQGYFPKTYKNGNPHQFAGRPQWKLLPEGQGLEVDVSADRCRIVKCITVNRVSDADKEAWDILEDYKDPVIHFPAKTDQAAGRNSSPAQEVDTQSATSRVSGKTEGSESKSLSAPLAKATPISWLKDAQMIISKVRNHKKAWPFLQAVDPVQDECPDYFNLISRPCDLGLIESKLAMQQYDTPTDLVYDLLLTFDNAMVYNPAQNQVRILATMSAIVMPRRDAIVMPRRETRCHYFWCTGRSCCVMPLTCASLCAGAQASTRHGHFRTQTNLSQQRLGHALITRKGREDAFRIKGTGARRQHPCQGWGAVRDR